MRGCLLAGRSGNWSENEETRTCGDALRRAIVGPSRRSPAGLRCSFVHLKICCNRFCTMVGAHTAAHRRCHFHPHSSISILLWTFSHKRFTFALTPESEYTLVLASKIAHSGSQGQTGGVFVRGCLVAGRGKIGLGTKRLGPAVI